MGKKSRDKGARIEREVTHLFKEAGFKTIRTGTLQTYKPNDAPDIIADQYRIEVKARANGFKQIYQYLEGNDLLVLRADNKEPLVVQPLSQWFNDKK
tara:strand:+ start:648 stop:938 length:291 start_codon:yes stop_codon:yes gene_type:complete